jgi:molecular chaperone GrpE
MPEDDHFDAAAAAAELEAALAEEVPSLSALRAAEARADRAEAEVTAARERLGREAEREIARGTRRVLLDVLEVLDDLERALAAPDDGSPLRRGVELVRRRFLTALAAHGVTPVDAAGEVFDPRVHDAISAVPATDDAQDGRIVAVVRGGYRIGDDVLRPAGVVVAKRR